MNRSMITAAVSMGQLQKKLDTIGNNLANVNTNGYKRRETQFSDLLAQHINNQAHENKEIGRLTPNGIRQGVGAKVAETNVRLEMGNIQKTDRTLDLALTKENQFFQIQTLDGNGNEVTRYTRDGAFYLSPVGNGEVELVTANGDRVLGAGGPIVIPENASEILIKQNGEIVVTFKNNTNETVGELELAEILKPQLLENAGDNLFAFPNLDELGLAAADVFQLVDPEQAAIQQFSLETSNVDVATEMTEMMVAQRSYQFNAKSISIADQMAGLVNGLR